MFLVFILPINWGVIVHLLLQTLRLMPAFNIFTLILSLYGQRLSILHFLVNLLHMCEFILNHGFVKIKLNFFKTLPTWLLKDRLKGLFNVCSPCRCIFGLRTCMQVARSWPINLSFNSTSMNRVCSQLLPSFWILYFISRTFINV